MSAAPSVALSVAPDAETITEKALDRSVKALFEWAGLEGESLVAVAAHLSLPEGDALDSVHPRLLASVPESAMTEAMVGFKGTFVAKAATFLAHKVAVYVCSDKAKVVEVSEVENGNQGSNVPEAKTVKAGRKVKLSNVIDPIDEMEVTAAGPSQVDLWFENYRNVKKGPPLEDVEPTPDQVNAMHVRIVELGAAPYADFSILTPHGRRMAKRLRHRSWLLQEDGSYTPTEVPGPATLDAWEACFGVYEVCLLMLRYPDQDQVVNKGEEVVTPIALETYLQHFRRLAKEHPEAWHLCQCAEDRCRAEHFPRIRRRLREEKGSEVTWSAVFIAAAMDDRYWDKEVRRPAIAFLARGGPKRLRGEEEDAGEDGPGPSKAARKRMRRQQAQAAGIQRGPPPPARPAVQPPPQSHQDKGKGKGSHPKKDRQNLFVTTAEGMQICFRYAKGEVPHCRDPCPDSRAHVCQKCLGRHPNASCSHQ
jgi:hypothetical protein